jgi:hypothetical protein
LRREITAGVRYVRSIPGFGGIVVLLASTSLAFSGGYAVGLPALARYRFTGGAISLGVLLAAHGVGQLLGAIAAGTTGLPRRLGLLVIGYAFAAAGVFSFIGVASNLILVCLAIGVLGFISVYADDVALPTWLQRRSERAMLGRVGSIADLARSLPAPISFLLIGWLASMSLTAAFAAAGGVMFMAAATLALNRSVRQLEL